MHSGSWVPTAERPARALLLGPEGSSEDSVTSQNWLVLLVQPGAPRRGLRGPGDPYGPGRHRLARQLHSSLSFHDSPNLGSVPPSSCQTGPPGPITPVISPQTLKDSQRPRTPLQPVAVPMPCDLIPAPHPCHRPPSSGALTTPHNPHFSEASCSWWSQAGWHCPPCLALWGPSSCPA